MERELTLEGREMGLPGMATFKERRWRLRRISLPNLERQVQSHLNKARTTDGVLQFTQVARGRAIVCAGARNAGREARKTVYRWISEEGIETDIVAGNVEARMIENIEGDDVIL